LLFSSEFRRQEMKPILSAKNISKTFTDNHHEIKALQNISLEIFKGETLGLVGESGSGKSTLGKCLARLANFDSGSVRFHDQEINHLKGQELRALRRKIQFIFQDPYSSLNPQMTIHQLIEEPLIIHQLRSTKAARTNRVNELLEVVGLRKEISTRHPYEFSGGQRQRIGIARALAVEPELLICDEPLSALDVSVQAQMVNFFQELQKNLGLTYLFIAHDLRMVRYLSNRVAVMKDGQIIEMADTESIYTNPKQIYTQELLSSVLSLDPKKRRLALRI
jgi:oligopeptide transport system ATP-binding protein